MRRIIPLLVLLVALPLAWAPSWAQDPSGEPNPQPAAPEPAGPSAGELLASLEWLAGRWQQADADKVTRFLASYTTPAGGEILSASKEIHQGKTVFFEFERFHVAEGRVVLQPYPRGTAAASFKLAEIHPGRREARFVNPENPFPSEIRYARTDRETLTITLIGTRGGAPVETVLRLGRER